jgi:hypothetical protein
MAVSTDQLAVPAIDLFAILLTGLSGYYVYLQKTTMYREVKSTLVYVHVLFIGVLILELLRNFFSTAPYFMTVYTDLGTSFILWDVLLLILVATAVYLRPEKTGLRTLFDTIFANRRVGVGFGFFLCFVWFADVYLFVLQPYTTSSVLNPISGIFLESTSFQPFYLYVVFVTLILFTIYSLILFLAARSRSKDPQVRTALLILPIVWTSIGVDLVIFNGYLLSQSIDAVGVGYLLAAVAFGITAAVFRRASLLSGFFEAVPLSRTTTPTHPFTSGLSMQSSSLVGKIFLLEVNPSSNYEQLINDFANEMLSNTSAVFTFTSKGSPIYNSLSKIEGVRFYVLTNSVSYPRPTEIENEILVPQNDQAILLDILHKTIVSVGKEGSVGIVFDNVSDLILSSNLETSYKFLKQANEIIGGGNVSALFLYIQGAHDERTVNLIKSLFANHVSQTAGGWKMTKGS